MNEQIDRLLVIDLETTGANPILHDVLAVGMVSLSDPSTKRVIYVRPDNPRWSPYAQANFQKFATVWQREAMPPATACAEIEHWLAQQFRGEMVTPVGHNVGFDVAFLRKLAFLAGKDEIDFISRRAVDTHTLLYLLYLRGMIPRVALSSDGAFAHFGIPVPLAERHTALGDALATRLLVMQVLDLLRATDDHERPVPRTARGA